MSGIHFIVREINLTNTLCHRDIICTFFVSFCQPEDAWTLEQHGLPQQLLNNPCPKIHLQTVSTLIDKHIPVSEHCFIFVRWITFILYWSLWTHIVRSSEVPLPMYTLSTCAPVNPSLVQDKYQLLPISSLKYYHQDVISFHTLLLLILSSKWHTDLWTPRSHLKSKVLTSPSRSCRKKFFGRSPSKTALTSGLRWNWIERFGDLGMGIRIFLADITRIRQNVTVIQLT